MTTKFRDISPFWNLICNIFPGVARASILKMKQKLLNMQCCSGASQALSVCESGNRSKMLTRCKHFPYMLKKYIRTIFKFCDLCSNSWLKGLKLNENFPNADSMQKLSVQVMTHCHILQFDVWICRLNNTKIIVHQKKKESQWILIFLCFFD